LPFAPELPEWVALQALPTGIDPRPQEVLAVRLDSLVARPGAATQQPGENVARGATASEMAIA